MKKILLYTGFFLCSFLWSRNMNAQILYVNQAVVGGTGDGSSWTNAFDNLQDALSNTTVSTTEIWVAQGTYYPDEGVGQTNDDRFATFVMQNDLGIYGGFDGTEMMRDQRDFVSNVTTLSGDIDQNDNSGGDNSGNSVHVITNRANGLNATALLDGFTITAGNADVTGNLDASGGGMLNSNVNPTILNCLFEDNEALFGGAVYNTNSNTTFSFCQFIQNTGTDQGGAMNNNTSSSVTISNCLFYKNSSALGCVLNFNSSPTITNCTFSENSNNGAIYNDNASPTISNSIIWNNDEGIFNSIGGTATVTNSIIQGGFTGTGNKDQDPLFVDAANGDLRLQACSPAIDMGDNSANSTSEDLDGNIRVFNTTIDMGAYEFQGASLLSILYVNQAVSGGTGDGSSWANAFDNLQDALNAVNNCSEIWVAQGTYYPDEGVGQTNDDRFATFVMQNDLGIYGGFDGTESIRDQRDFVSNVTTLSGDIDQNDNSGGDNSGNSVHVITNRANGLNATAILDGFTVTAGNANISGSFNLVGGGMLNVSSNPTILNCTFRANAAGFGGAIGNEFSSNTEITNCQFLSNQAQSNGGALNNSNSSATLTNCSFLNNTSGLEGASVVQAGANLMVINCTFSQNISSSGPNIVLGNSPIVNINNSILWGNGLEILFGTVTNSIVQGGFTGTGNKDQDPLFVDAANGDLRLQACSPAINMGNNSANSTSEDLDGNLRVFATIDMGAYERQSVPSEMLATSMQMVTLPQVNVTDYQVDCDNLIATVEQTGASVIDGDVTAFVFIDGSVQQFNSTPYVQRHYEINPATDASTATGTVTLYFTQAEFDAFNADPSSTLDLPTSASDATGKANLRITKFFGASAGNTGNPADYNNGSTLIDPDDTDIVWNAIYMRWEVAFETVGFSGFFVQTENIALPVELLSFKAEKLEAKSLLTWTTASEQDNIGFEIEHIQKLESKDWQKIGFVKGAGTILEQIDYKFYDENPIVGENYYRLKQIDTDGSFSYSEIKVVDFRKSMDNEVIIAPNPTDGIVTLKLPEDHNFESISIFNSTGQLILQSAIQTQISLTDLADGWYWIRLENGRGGRFVERVLKQ